MTLSSLERLLQTLSERISLLALARTAGDDWVEAHVQAEACALLESILSAHLRTAGDWDEAAWIQSVLPTRVEIAEGRRAAILSARVMWRAHQGSFLDPLSAEFDLTADGASIQTYVLRFGDAGREASRSGRQFPAETPPPERWRYVFTRSLR